MSTEDQQRWDQRYQNGAYAERLQPSEYLRDWVQNRARDRAPDLGARALDIACGSGRNSQYLGERGYAVTGLDVSAVALAQARVRCVRLPSVTFVRQDFDEPGALSLLPMGEFSLVVVMRFLNLDLLPQLLLRLQPDGVLLAEVNLEVPAAVGGSVAGPALEPAGRRSRFRAAAGALRNTLAPLARIEHYVEGTITDPDGATSVVARATAIREH